MPSSLLTRRDFLRALGAGAATTALVGAAARVGLAQDAAQEPAPMSSVSNVAMDPSGYREVRRPPKPGAARVVDDAERDALEHQLSCQCPCTLDVYTCRTTDFTCQVSPAMHRDVMSLVEGGYTAQEILDTFVEAYGEQVLTAPRRSGFNIVGYLMPFTALGAGAAVVALLIRRWGRRAAAVAAEAPQTPPPVDGTPDELARLEAAVRGDDA